MHTLSCRLIHTVAAAAAIGWLFPVRAAAQPLVATAGAVGDICTDPAQSSCSRGTLYVVNGATLQVQGTAPLWQGTSTTLRRLIVHPGGAFVYAGYSSPAATPSSHSIDVIDLRTMARVTTYNVGGVLAAISADGTRLYLRAPGAVLVLDSATGAMVANIPATEPSAVAVSPDGSRIYIGGGTSPAWSITVVDAATQAPVATIPLATNFVSQLEITGDGAHLFAIGGFSRVLDIDTASNTVAGIITDFGGPTVPNRIAIAGPRLYVAASFQSPGVTSGEGIAVIDIATRSFLAKTNVVDPWGLAVSPDGSRVWTATLGEPRLLTIDTAINQVIGRLADTGPPLDMAAIPTGRHAEVVIDQPGAGAIVQQPFNISGWAADAMGLLPGPGVATVHVWAFPASGAAPTFVGTDYGRPRPDVGAFLGPSFTNSGYVVTVRGLPPGDYQLVAFALSLRSGQFSIARNVPLTIRTGAQLVVDAPRSGSSVPSRFVVAGWALDTGAATGSGIDVVHVWAYPDGGAPMLLGAATLGDPRPDVGAYFGAQFANAGYHLEVPHLPPGGYTLIVYGRSTVTNTISVEQHVRVTVPPRQPLIWIDTPAPNATVATTFAVSGWALELNAASGTGVDLVHIWATSSSGAASFLGAVTYGLPRPDVGAWLGSQYGSSGFSVVASLPPGSYTLSVYARSTETGTFRYWKTVQIVVQ